MYFNQASSAIISHTSLISSNGGSMWVQETNFRNESEDFKHMCRLVIELNNPEDLGHHWTLGQLIDWQWGIWNDANLDPSFFEKNCRLFYNYLGDLVGFAISENGTNRF